MLQQPSGITIKLTIRPDRLAELSQILKNDMGALLGCFGRIGTIHFARILIVPGEPSQNAPAYLVLIVDFDGQQRQLLRDFSNQFGENIDAAMACCAEFPASGFANHDQRIDFLHKYAIANAALYINRLGQSVDRVKGENAIRMKLRGYVDSNQATLKTMPPREVVAKLHEFVRSDAECSRLAEGYQPLPSLPQVGDIVVAVFLVILALFFLWILIPVLVIGLLWIRFLELRDPFRDTAPDLAKVEELQALEDVVPINQFSAYGFLKPHPLRAITARVVLWGVGFVVTRFTGNRSLFGVKTIHFARWTYLSKRELFFASNYDGSLESYMDDFIDRLAWGLNAVFSNGINYPPTRFLILDGAKHEAYFKNFIRTHQLPTQVWYSAYPDLTCADIAASNEVCEGLLTEQGRNGSLKWLRSL